MRRSRMVAVAGAVALATSAFGATAATAAPSAAPAAEPQGSVKSYVVLTEKGGDAKGLAKQLARQGATVTSVNASIGMVTVESTDAGFAKSARSLEGVDAAAENSVVGRAPKAQPDRMALERLRPEGAGKAIPPSAGKKLKTDPLDGYLWGMDMIDAFEAHQVEMGSKRVRVGVMDTGVDGSHPDIAPNFDRRLSRNFTTDADDPGGAECQYGDCADPADVDDNGHGTHVAGTIGAAMNGLGVSGVSPKVDLVNVRAGQDSGYFLLGPTVDALTYSGDAGLDVVNMSFYVDPWAYTCIGGAPEDSTEEAASQDAIIEAMTRALEYAHDRGVTLVGALGNGHDDLANPRTDTSSPDYGFDGPHPRTIDNETCFDLPVEGPHVVGVSSVGPSERKAYYSNWTTDLTSGEIEVSAPGGDYYDGTPGPQNMILSTAPLNVLQAIGDVDENGDITPQGEGWVMKDCHEEDGQEVCGYYDYKQGTSMASPHAAGVAALVVAAHGGKVAPGDFGLDPDVTGKILMETARDTACPNGDGVLYDYPTPPIPDSYNGVCVGGEDFNGFYGDGIVNALAAVS